MKRNTILFVLVLSLVSILGKAQNNSYYFSKTVEGEYEQIVSKLKEALKGEGFGVITEVDMHTKIGEKLDVEMKRYKLLGVCNPKLAYTALGYEENIGLFLPCKMIVKEVDEKTVEIVSVDPEVMMQSIGNEKLDQFAKDVGLRLRKVLDEF